eukprot:CAMPEP_0202971084 /NCGR_PEP_ID=MMETSP1396-20130829/23266_1 /ASSEMBLY_ACC=CAM_ASM_000872 /TAXON_ID= /ORGANISM="Pseudokeronopsis sp., Strain Brazil" /LENGTH=68 /DNA_ID=CAMNT_0049700091 /DNA_START=189 /DNA_END=392 /DNA_ORIENTATION=-
MDYSLLLVFYRKSSNESEMRALTMKPHASNEESLEMQELSNHSRDMFPQEQPLIRGSQLQSDQDVKPG